MNLLFTNEARALIARKVSWIEGKMLNYLTFKRMVKEKVLLAAKILPRGQSVFIEEEVLALIAKFPTKQPPNRIGIVNWLKGERPKNQGKAKKKR